MEERERGKFVFQGKGSEDAGMWPVERWLDKEVGRRDLEMSLSRLSVYGSSPASVHP